jgi:twitching motility protein PilT
VESIYSQTHSPTPAAIPVADSPVAPPNGTRPLPAAYYDILAAVPPEIDGEDRIGWLIEQIRTVSKDDREAARATYDRLAVKMVEIGASDLDLGGPATLGRPWYRVDGAKRAYDDMGHFTMEEADLLILSLLSPTQQERLLDRLAVDFGYALPDSETSKGRRFRTTVYYDNRHLALCKRLLAGDPRPLASLRFPRIIEAGFMFRHVRDGLTLITGVTGSGKSTTLDAIVDANNDDTEAHILIVAQPLEYIHTSRRCIIRHREVGTDVRSFVDGIVQGLRQDPDIVVVGEMRDAETISTAMEMADTGHKVFSTLHTGSAIESIDRIVAEYPPTEQERVRYRLGDVLRCIVSQKLLPSIGGGRVLAKEVLWVTSAARAAIKNGNTHEIYQMMWQGTEYGMTTMEQDLARLVSVGDVAMETAVNYANNKRRLLSLLK